MKSTNVTLYANTLDGMLAVYQGQIERLQTHIQTVRAQTPNAVPFDLDNVAQWLELSHAGTSNASLIRDLPPCVPPYPVMWCEMANDPANPTRNRIGVLLMTEKRSSETERQPWKLLGVHVSPDEPDETAHTEFEIPDGGFLVYAIALVGNEKLAAGRVPLVLPAVIFAGLDEHGQVLRRGDYLALRFMFAPDVDVTDEESQAIIGQLGTGFVTALFASSLCHCANVGETENRLPRQQARERERKQLPLVVWKTITVEPMRKPRTADETASYLDGERTARRMHMVRGHFAEYGPEFGKGKLFGKWSGRFWVPAMVKGSPTEGINVSSYNVKATKGNT